MDSLTLLILMTMNKCNYLLNRCNMRMSWQLYSTMNNSNCKSKIHRREAHQAIRIEGRRVLFQVQIKLIRCSVKESRWQGIISNSNSRKDRLAPLDPTQKINSKRIMDKIRARSSPDGTAG